MKTALIIAFLIISVVLAIIVMMQEGKGGGFINSVGANTESYWGKNKGKTKEGILRKVTAVLGVAFMVLALLLSSKFIK